MTEREQRVVANEVVARQVNEELAPWQTSDVLGLLCECGRNDCKATVSIERGDYERVRSDPISFVLVNGHELPDVESVVSLAGAYTIVQKDAADARELAEQTDPRS